MATNRKLQGEIDRLMKKVSEGCLEFDNIYSKVYSASSSNQKEKYEADLKKEIKKLQRCRDQLKTWIASAEVKQKTPLQEARRIIEEKMEKFKSCERDSKTKAFSKAGLSMEDDDDDKSEIRSWIVKTQSALKTQIDLFESEVEATPIRKRNTPRVEHIQESITKHKFHLNKLEKILRNLENDTISVGSIMEIKDSVDHYVEHNQDPEFFEDEGVYDTLGLKEDEEKSSISLINSLDSLEITSGLNSEEEEDNLSQTSTNSTGSGNSGSTLNSGSGSISNTSNKSQPSKKDPTGTAIPTSNSRVGISGGTPPMSYSILSSKPKQEGNLSSGGILIPPKKQTAPIQSGTPPTANNNIAQQPKGILRSNGNTLTTETPQSNLQAPTAIRPTSLPPQVLQPSAQRVEYNQFARNAGVSTLSGTGTSQFPPLSVNLSSQQPVSELPKNPTPAEYYQVLTKQNPSFPKGNEKDSSNNNIGIRMLQPQGVTGQSQHIQSLQAMAMNSIPSVQQQQIPTNIPHQQIPQQHMNFPQAIQSPLHETQLPISGNRTTINAQKVKDEQTEDSKNSETFEGLSVGEPGTLEQLASITLDKINKLPMSEQEQQLNAVPLLECSMSHIPDAQDSERPRQYVPRNPVAIPTYYPQLPPPIFETPAAFEKFDTDTLFFIFYYQQGTYQQYLAAKELKKQSWRYHKKYLTWFQRHEEPKEITNDYEQGTYVYFDYETGWCQRKKTEFTFEYRFLEDYD